MTEINLNTIVSNIDNSRESAPKLQGLGYGIVEPVKGGDKPSLFALALGTPNDKKQFCELIEQFEEGITHMAQTMDQFGQLQNCRVRPVGNGQYALTFGARRCLAILYRCAKNGEHPMVVVTVSEADEKSAIIESAAENIHLPPSFMDQARLFKRLQDQGMTNKEIARCIPMGKAGEQNIRHRVRLLNLSPEDQFLVHHGKLSQDEALNLLKKEEGKEKSKPAKSSPGKKKQHKESKRGKQNGLKAALEAFINQITAIDLETLSPSDPDELLQLIKEARRLLTVVEEKAANGTLPHVG